MLHTRILTLLQVATMPKVPYACAGFRLFTCKSLQLYNLPKIQKTFYGSAGSQRLPQNSLRSAGSRQFKVLLRLCRHPIVDTQILMLVKVWTIQTFPYTGAGFGQFKHFLTPVQDLDNSHANAFACAGSDNSHVNPYACEGSQEC
ncbi:hypothetical protein O181_085118 [Austropuccinia psidii MF-1]|uniref:Uncharacterized protein n=1 Tax=Austropuccinia psidii MF-1 TaxID=1389203 RepID=A0A9Q3FSJ7_9BASI|nr:hypothetical protein [Austropuccinia psidii MF-1]